MDSGTRLGPYEILEPLGAGGMGEVYRARDSKLGREVAIKILSRDFAGVEAGLARFEREARLLASLNHPNIATLFDRQVEGSVHFLIMECVPGDTLAERIQRGPIPVEEAMLLFHQIAEALEAAHDNGVVHRDLKPANIKITPEGKAKVLDFGIAKALSGEQVEQDISHTPTLTVGETEAGALLGTAPYMSPEQARGKAVDKRGDIWAFGCCLYEALSARPAFRGETVSDTISMILTAEPAWDRLPANVPRTIRRLLHRCLEKDEQRRLRDIGEARIAIDDAAEEDDEDPVASPEARRAGVRHAARIAVAASVVTGLIAAGLTWLAASPDDPAVARLHIVPSPQAPLSRADLAISPDGRHVIYSSGEASGNAGSGLAVRAIDALDPVVISDLGSPEMPFVSPDGRWIAFADDVNALRKVPLAGGPAITICSLAGTVLRGGTWGGEGTIVYATDDPATGLWRVSDSGGDPEVLTIPEQGVNDHLWPHLLPSGRAVLLTVVPLRTSADPQIAVFDLDTSELRILTPGMQARYVRSGHLVYGSSGSLRAVRFDLDRLEVVGPSVEVQAGVALGLSGVVGSSGFAVADNGTLAYVPGDLQMASRSLVWVSRDGSEEELDVPPDRYVIARISPDGTRIALDNRDPIARIWIWDIERQTRTLLTLGTAAYPLWTPDSQRVLFTSFDSGVGHLSWQAADGTTPIERLAEGSNSRYATSFTADGTGVVFREEGRPTGLDLLMLRFDASGEPLVLVETPHNELNAEISPDGRWLAHRSNESGRDEVYVRPFPETSEAQYLVSANGGTQPAWAADGRELFYRAPDGALMSVPVRLEPTFSAGTPTRLLDARHYRGGPGRSYDVSPDGTRFLMITEDEASNGNATPGIVVVQNWFEELQSLAPATR